MKAKYVGYRDGRRQLGARSIVYTVVMFFPCSVFQVMNLFSFFVDMNVIPKHIYGYIHSIGHFSKCVGYKYKSLSYRRYYGDCGCRFLRLLKE